MCSKAKGKQVKNAVQMNAWKDMQIKENKAIL